MQNKAHLAIHCKDEILGNIQHLLPHHKYRNHGTFSNNDLLTMLRHDFNTWLENDDALTFALMHHYRPTAVCCSRPLPWDSNHFGLRMAALDCLCDSSTTMADLQILIRTTLTETIKRHAPQHITCHVDADNYALFNALTQIGFLLRDTKRTYVARPKKALTKQKHRPYSPREYNESDEEQTLLLFASRQFHSRFTRETEFPPQKAANLYPLWAQQLIKSPSSERLLHVVERGDRIVAAGGVKNIEFKPYGIAKTGLGDGIFACHSQAAGSYGSVLLSLIESGISKGYAFLETKVSLNNRPATRVLEHIGADAVTCHHALHMNGYQ